MKTIVRATAIIALYLLFPGTLAFGLYRGFGLAEWEVTLNFLGLVGLVLMTIVLDGKVDPLGGGRVGISGDEIGRQG